MLRLGHLPAKQGRAPVLLPLLAVALMGVSGIGAEEAPEPVDRVAGTEYILNPDAPDVVGGIRLLGAVDLTGVSFGGIPLAGLSALAWDEDEGLLYALSDRARLFHLEPVFRDGRLTGAVPRAVARLRGRDGGLLSHHLGDAEGMAATKGDNGLRGDGELLIAFEQRPRIDVYKPDGRWLATYSLPAEVRDVEQYSSGNQALECVTVVDGIGPITGPERPFWRHAREEVPIFSASGRRWLMPLSPEVASSLVALEALPDGRVLTLERSWVSPLHPVVTTLRSIDNLADTPDGERLTLSPIARLSSFDGWRLDNFEGLTRHRGARFFMVSDDNERRFQRTLLVYFEMLGSSGASAGPAVFP